MSYTITASYSSCIGFDLDELFDEVEGYDFGDIESYNVRRATLYLTMKDGEVLEFESMIDTDFKYPSDVTLLDENGDEIELEDLPTLQELMKMNNNELAKLEAELATLNGELK
jgi:hypothetical protein